MTATTGYSATTDLAWQEYLRREHAARDLYLQVIAKAGQEYLTGPYPDRDAYQIVERQAWMTYYQAGRTAWLWYTAAMARPQQPPSSGPYPVKGEAVTGTGWPQKLPISEESAVWLQNGGNR